MKPIPPPAIPPNIQKPQNSSPNSARVRAMTRSVYAFVAQGMIVCNGPKKLRSVAAPNARISPARKADKMASSTPIAACRAFHSRSLRSRYFSVTISSTGPTSCAMPPCTSTRLASSLRRVSADTSNAWCRGSKQPRLMPYSRSPFCAICPSINLMPGHTPPESCQPPPEPPSHSPRIARAATNRRSSSPNVPIKPRVWPVALIATAINEASKFVETASREPFGISFTWLATSSP